MSDYQKFVFDAERRKFVGTFEEMYAAEDWRASLRRIAECTKYVFVSLYIPENQLGFVKSHDDL